MCYRCGCYSPYMWYSGKEYVKTILNDMVNEDHQDPNKYIKEDEWLPKWKRKQLEEENK